MRGGYIIDTEIVGSKAKYQVKGVLDTHEMIGSAASLCCGFYCVCQSVFTWGGVRRVGELTDHHLSAGFISVMTVLVPYINNI